MYQKCIRNLFRSSVEAIDGTVKCSESQCKAEIQQMVKHYLKVRPYSALKMSNIEKSRRFWKKEAGNTKTSSTEDTG